MCLESFPNKLNWPLLPMTFDRPQNNLPTCIHDDAHIIGGRYII